MQGEHTLLYNITHIINFVMQQKYQIYINYIQQLQRNRMRERK